VWLGGESALLLYLGDLKVSKERGSTVKFVRQGRSKKSNERGECNMAGKKIHLAKMSTEEFQERLEKLKFMIIPIGSLEQHGPNLSLETDAAIAMGLSERLARRCFPYALITPVINFGLSRHHMNFPGTVTLSLETFCGLVTDVVKSLKEHGVKNFLIINGHGGNMPAINLLLTKLRHEEGVHIAAVFTLGIVPDVIREGVEREETGRRIEYGHACEVETSLGLALAPEIIVRKKLLKGETKDYPYKWSDLRGGVHGGVVVPYWFSEITENGAFGDPRKASREFGERIVNACMGKIMDFLETWLPGGLS